MLYIMEYIGVIALIVGGCALCVAVLYDSSPQDVEIISPEYMWDGTSLRFRNTNGSWGDYVDLKGNAGERGPIGPTGASGVKGDAGISPRHMWNGTRLRFQNSNGSWGNWTDLKGINGTKGLNYVNLGSTMDIVSNTGTYVMSPDNASLTRFKYVLKVLVDDPDSDDVQTKVFYRFNVSDSWVEKALFFDTDVNLSVSAFVDLLVPVNTTIFWGVQMWDGCNLIMKYVNHTVEYI